MAPPIPANKTLKIQTTWTNADGTTGSSRFFASYSGGAPTAAQLTTVAGQIMGAVVAELTPLQHSSWSTSNVIITDLTSDTSPVGEFAQVNPGTLAGGRLPSSTCALVSQKTGRRYRGGHSRVYLPLGDDTKLLTDSTWTGAFVTAFGTAWETVVAEAGAYINAVTSGAQLVMTSFYDGFTNEAYGSPVKYRRVPTPRAAGVNYVIVTYEAQANLASQRRRLLLA
jgi:hypothetical protein